MTAGAQFFETGSAPSPVASNTGVYPDSSGNLHQLTAAGVDKQLLGGGCWTVSTPADPTGTTDTTGKMMGLAGTFTPATTGRVLVTITGNIASSALADGGACQLTYGTGAAPANAGALTGTAVGTIAKVTAVNANADMYPFTCTYPISGLTLGTAYWVDLCLKAITAGTASVTSVTISAVEV